MAEAKDELGKLTNDEISELLELKKKIEAGTVVILPAEPLDLPEFSRAETEQCKRLILDALSKGHTYPSDIAEKHDLDIFLVLRCVEELEKEGRIEEIT